MLRFLAVRHFAVIDALEVEFDAGLNVLTGETGAGKSILVEAVGLLLGGRASGDLVRTGEETASVQAIFESGGEELIVRREVTAQGRSRAFINGVLATAGALKDLSARLVELHGQHEHQTLLDPSTHLAIVDASGGLESLRAEVALAYETMQSAAEALARVRRSIAERDTRMDLVAFQLNELDRAALRSAAPGEIDEDAELAAARQVLASAERVERLCEESYAALYDSDQAVLAGLTGVWRRIGELAALDPQFQPFLDARDGIKPQLEDLARFLRHYADGIDASPARLQQVEERLALLERLKRKYGPSLADVVARRDALRRELSDLQGGDETIAGLERACASTRATFLGLATELSAARRTAALAWSRALVGLLGELAMERTAFEVRFNETPLPESAWSAAGIDAGEFFVSPNPGEDLRPLARIVSGGELSRIMLAIKTLTATSRFGFSDAADRAPSQAGPDTMAERGDGVPAERVPGAGAPGLIFDEVDAGIGGRVADVVGRKLRTLGSAFQVLCITHLPQIAAYADTHFAIEKRVERGRTLTSVRRLDRRARVEELARMLGGAEVTEAIRRSAREMIEQRRGQTGPVPVGRGESEMPSKGESESPGKAKAKRV